MQIGFKPSAQNNMSFKKHEITKDAKEAGRIGDNWLRTSKKQDEDISIYVLKDPDAGPDDPYTNSNKAIYHVVDTDGSKE